MGAGKGLVYLYRNVIAPPVINLSSWCAPGVEGSDVISGANLVT